MAIRIANIADLAWAAGLFEGEGSIYVPVKPTRSLRICIASTDEDVIQRFHGIVGVGGAYDYVPKNSLGKKRQFWWYVTGHENVQAILTIFWGWLGKRRRLKATAALKFGALQKPANKYRRLKSVCGLGHNLTEENTYIYPSGRRTCRQCRKVYMAQYYRAYPTKFKVMTQ